MVNLASVKARLRRVEDDVSIAGDNFAGTQLGDPAVVKLEPLPSRGREAVGRIVASDHSSVMIANGGQIVASESIWPQPFVRRHMLPEVDVSETEVDECVVLPGAVVQESDQLNG